MSNVTSPKESNRNTVEVTSSSTGANGKEKKDSRLEWTDQIESLLSGWADTAAVYKWLHDKSHRKYKAKNKWLAVPTSILSIVTGSLSIGLQGYVPAEYMSIGQGALGGLGIFIGILQGLQTQFGWAQRSERHASSCLGWGKLHRNISIELAVEKEYRKDCDSFVKVCRMEYDRLTEQSPAIPSDVLNLFKDTFKNKEVNQDKGENSDYEDEEDQLVLPDICDSIKHTKVYKAGITNPDSIVKNVYDVGKTGGEDKEGKKIVTNTIMGKIKQLEEKLSPINKLKEEELKNRYYRAESTIKSHLDEVDNLPRKSISHHYQPHQPNYVPVFPMKQPPPISSDRKKAVVNEFQGIHQIINQAHKTVQLGLQPKVHHPPPINLGYERPNVKNLINKFNPNHKVEIVVDNPLLKDELKEEVKNEKVEEKVEEKKEENTTPVQEIRPIPQVEIPRLNLDNVVEEEMKRQNGGNLIVSAKKSSKRSPVKIVFSDDEDAED